MQKPTSIATSRRPTVTDGSPLTGIGLKVTSVCVFLAMSSLLKASEGIPAGELVFFRSFFAIVPILVFLAVRGEIIEGFKTRFPLGHVARGAVGTISMGLGFFALTRLPLPEAITINYATPLLIVVFSAVFLGETVRLYRWSAAIIGLVGVLVIVAPQLSVFSGGRTMGGDAALGALAAIIASCFAAAAALLVRKLVQTERSSTIVMYFSLSSSVIALATLPFGWAMPTPQQAILLVSAGFAGGIGQILLTESYRYAEISVIAPFEYSSLILSIGVGYFIFGDVPTVTMMLGGLILTGAGLFIIFREHQLGLDRAKARQVTPLQG